MDIWPLTQEDCDWLDLRIDLAIHETQRLTPEMSVLELKDALKDIPGIETMTVGYSRDGKQLVTVGDKVVEVGPMASNEEIRSALLNPFIPTKNTRVTMASPLQGIGQKLSLLKHNAELGATKISSRVEALSTRMDTAVTKTTRALDAQEKDIADVETFVEDIEKATNT